MSLPEDALTAYRLRSQSEMLPPRPVAFVLCSEAYAAAALVASFNPAIVLQEFEGLHDSSAVSVRATLSHAVCQAAVRTIVLCGHKGCGRARGVTLSAPSGQSELLRARARLAEDEVLGPLIAQYRVNIELLWFDETEGDVYSFRSKSAGFVLMGDRDIRSFLRTDGV